MSSIPSLVIIAFILIPCILIVWIMQTGIVRGSLALICRFLWIAPIFLGLFPQSLSKLLPKSLTIKPIHLLVDDSQSMKSHGATSETPLQKSFAFTEALKAQCLRLGCSIKESFLSAKDSRVRKGFTPLKDVLSSWFFEIDAAPWILLSDGGDLEPSQAWPKELRNVGLENDRKTKRGMVIGVEPPTFENIWIEKVKIPPLSFENQALNGDIVVKKSAQYRGSLNVQVQANIGKKVVSTTNIHFAEGQEEVLASLTIPPLQRGQHLITVTVLPSAEEKILWDNEAYTQVEVIANTLGVLHLLGSPSWDGRFLRRALKAEPKYDLISFFILRDPWDSQEVNERELSLIPFPVARLFNEELVNFRVIILQNFNLLQFLLPEYQENLVRFVREGGGLFFIGGNRALKSTDIQNSPLRKIIPFDLKKNTSQPPRTLSLGDLDLRSIKKTGPWFDADMPYTISLAKPEPQKRALATVYDAWEKIGGSLTGLRGLNGLHHMDDVMFKENEHTPLLYAHTPTGNRIPLAVASYPDKGRAVWLFSDDLWHLGQTQDSNTSRSVYDDFIQGALTWLLRRDLKKPMIAKSFQLNPGARGSQWQVHLQGPATRYVGTSARWKVSVCDHPVPIKQILIEKSGLDEWLLKGNLKVKLAGGARCTFKISGEHRSVGSVKASVTTVVPKRFRDDEFIPSRQNLATLATHTGSSLSFLEADAGVNSTVQTWLEEVSGREGIALPPRYKNIRDFFWIIDSMWFWLLLLFLPLEVILRRWDKLANR